MTNRSMKIKLPNIRNFKSQIEKHKKAIAAHRDALCTLIADAEDITGCCDAAIESLNCACDELSEYL